MRQGLGQLFRTGLIALAVVGLWAGWALGADPSPKEVNLKKAEEIFKASLRSDDLERNRQYLRQILDLAPNSPYGHFSKGWFFAQDEKYAQAIVEYREAVVEKPDFSEARHNLASAYFYSGEIQKAIAEFKKVIELSPLWAEAHLNLGTAYFLGNEPFAAIAQYERTLQLNPRLLITHYYIGLVLDRMGRWSEAHEHYSAFLQVDAGADLREYADRARNRLGEIWVLIGHQAT